MKFQPAVNARDNDRSAQSNAHLTKENALFALSVALAFAFVTSCIFLLG
jgi:hypothetical protein